MKKRVFLIILLFCGLLTYVNATDFSTYLDNISEDLHGRNNDVVSVKDIIKTFCTSVLSAGSFSQDNFDYSGGQSAFVYLLCSNINDNWSSETPGFQKTDGFFKLTSFAQLGIQDLRPIASNTTTQTNFCSLKTKMSQCNLSKYIPKLFNMIINDYTNLKQPTIFGFIPGDDLDAIANVFSSSYFNLDLCSQGKSKRDYPSTCRTLKSYIKNSRNVSTDVKIFLTKNIKKDEKACIQGDSYSLLLCGLYGDSQNSLQRFLNLTYNELFYYRLFKSYYSLMIQADPTSLLKLDFATANNEVYKRISTFNNEFTWSQQALGMTIRMLRDMYSAFPLHIGFLMYQEDLKGFMLPLSKIYKPLSQFYSTMQNVQEKQSK